MSYINTIEPEDSEGRLKEIYDEIIEKRGKVAEVYQIQSLNPESIKNHLDLYMTIMFGKSPLKRVTRELLGTVVSVSNGCDYCATHHSEAVNHYWKDTERLSLLLSDFRSAQLNELDLALAEFAEKLTLHPSEAGNGQNVEKLKKLGLDDRAILDATMIISYFNYVNRLVLSLGAELEPTAGKGYKMEGE